MPLGDHSRTLCDRGLVERGDEVLEDHVVELLLGAEILDAAILGEPGPLKGKLLGDLQIFLERLSIS